VTAQFVVSVPGARETLWKALGFGVARFSGAPADLLKTAR